MSLFKPARQNVSSTFKAGVFGEAGSGKTFTLTSFSVGFLQDLQKRDPERASKPVYFLDTENGSDFVLPRFEAAGFPDVLSLKTRAFTDLVPALKEAEKNGSMLIIDSITHFWQELVEAYLKRNPRSRGLQMNDWNALKNQWARFTTAYIASDCHILMAGRAGFEYDFNVDDETGKKEIEKSGVKMKGESGLAYEPNLMIYLQRQQEMDGKDVSKTWHTATVVKDRTSTIDGKTFKDPTYLDIQPHIACLALGDKNNSVDVTRNSEDSMPMNTGKTEWQRDQEEKERVLDEVEQLLVKHYPGQTAENKSKKGELVEEFFGTRSWERVKQFSLKVTIAARDGMWLKLEEKPYAITLPLVAGPGIPDDDHLPV